MFLLFHTSEKHKSSFVSSPGSNIKKKNCLELESAKNWQQVQVFETPQDQNETREPPQ